MKAKKELVRVVRAPDGAVAIDPTGKLPGRGAYICKVSGCVENAGKRRILERNLKIADCGVIYQALSALCDDNGQ